MIEWDAKNIKEKSYSQRCKFSISHSDVAETWKSYVYKHKKKQMLKVSSSYQTKLNIVISYRHLRNKNNV